MRHSKSAGFTLIELGIVLIILSLITSAILTIATQRSRSAKMLELKVKMDTIETALLNYRKSNNRVPCPGRSEETNRSENFGFQGIDPGSCIDGDNLGNMSVASSYQSGNYTSGMVPVRTLGLSDEMAYDPWGGRFLYAVDKRATDTDAFLNTSPTDLSSLGSFTVKDDADNGRTDVAIVVIVSFGPDGHGAYMSGGQRKTSYINNLRALENCDCDGNGAATGAGIDSTFYMQSATDDQYDPRAEFDDIVRYYTRQELTSATTDELTEHLGN